MSDAFEKSWDIVKEDWPLGPGQKENAFNEQEIIRYILSHVMDLHQSEDPSELEHLMWLGQELSRAQQPDSQPPHEDWDPDLSDDDPMQESPRDYMMGNRYNPPQMLPRGGVLPQIMQFLQSNPEVWSHSGDDFTGGMSFSGISRQRPSEQDLFGDDWEMTPEEMATLGDQYDEDFPYDLQYRLGYDRQDTSEPYGTGGFRYDHDRGGHRGEVSRFNILDLLAQLASDSPDEHTYREIGGFP